jgi:hypothetical protein
LSNKKSFQSRDFLIVCCPVQGLYAPLSLIIRDYCINSAFSVSNLFFHTTRNMTKGSFFHPHTVYIAQ